MNISGVHEEGKTNARRVFQQLEIHSARQSSEGDGAIPPEHLGGAPPGQQIGKHYSMNLSNVDDIDKVMVVDQQAGTIKAGGTA